MNFTSAFTGIKSVVSMFSGGGGGGGRPQQQTPKGIYWARYAARSLILILVLFIFVYWPVDAYNTDGFDGWSVRMSGLPDQVWYILLGVILSWGATEIAGRRGGGGFTSVTTYGDGGYGDGGYGGYSGGYDAGMDPMLMDGPPLDGRFANLTEEDPMLMEGSPPNEVLEQWRQQVAEDES